MASQKTLQTSKQLRRAATSGDAPIWARMAELALKPSIARRVVNIKKISALTKQSDVVAVPGKVLAVGTMAHPVTIGAFSISRAAATKIKDAGGKIVSMEELAKMHPAGTGVVILG